MLERQLYLARKTVIEMLNDRGLKTNNIIKGFIPSDFEIIFKSFDNYSGTFDIETSDDYGNRTYVKFIRYIDDKNNSIKNISGAKDVKSAKIELKNLYNFIVSTKNLVVQDTLIFVICYGDQIEECHINFEEQHDILQIFHISQLQFNITHHSLVPRHILINETEKYILKKKLYLNSFNRLPTILGSDPIAKYYNMKNNDICKILRPSKTTSLHPFYRICKSNKDRVTKIRPVAIIEKPKRRKRVRNPKKTKSITKSPKKSTLPKTTKPNASVNESPATTPKSTLPKTTKPNASVNESPATTPKTSSKKSKTKSLSSKSTTTKSSTTTPKTSDKKSKTKSSSSKSTNTESPEITQEEINYLFDSDLDTPDSKTGGGSNKKIKLIQSLKLDKKVSLQNGGDINLVPEKTLLNAENIETILSKPKIDQGNIKIQPKIETNLINNTILNANKDTTNVKTIKTIIPNIDKTNIIGTTIENGSDQLVLNDSALNEAISLGNVDMNLLND